MSNSALDLSTIIVAGITHTVAGVPDGSLGNNGDYAYNPGTYELYGPKASGAWPSAVSLKGAQGDPAVELAYAELTSNWSTTGNGSGSETDITGLSISFVMPNRPVMLRIYAPAWNGSVAGKLFIVRIRKVSGTATGFADGADLTTSSVNVSSANLAYNFVLERRLDTSIWIPGTTYTFKAMGNVNTSGGTVQVLNTTTAPIFIRAI